jgi:hypothetical protein
LVVIKCLFMIFNKYHKFSLKISLSAIKIAFSYKACNTFELPIFNKNSNFSNPIFIAQLKLSLSIAHINSHLWWKFELNWVYNCRVMLKSVKRAILLDATVYTCLSVSRYIDIYVAQGLVNFLSFYILLRTYYVTKLILFSVWIACCHSQRFSCYKYTLLYEHVSIIYGVG